MNGEGCEGNRNNQVFPAHVRSPGCYRAREGPTADARLLLEFCECICRYASTAAALSASTCRGFRRLRGGGLSNPRHLCNPRLLLFVPLRTACPNRRRLRRAPTV